MLPVSSLREPPSNILLRDSNNMFVTALKKEMLENPTGGLLISAQLALFHFQAPRINRSINIPD